MNLLRSRDLVIGITPFQEPNAELAVAVERAGGLGVLGLGTDVEANRAALANAARWSRGGSRLGSHFGVRVPAGCPLAIAELPDQVDTVILGAASPWSATDPGLAGRRVLIEVISLAQARQAAAAATTASIAAASSIAASSIATDSFIAADDAPASALDSYGLIAKGSESGGPIGDTTAFVLLQQLLADPAIDLPIWCAGGIGRHTAAAAIAGGAAGVVLDAQLALVKEARLPAEIQAAIRAMDGSETTVIGGYRVYTRPDLPVAGLASGEEVGTAVEGMEGGKEGGNGATPPAPPSTRLAPGGVAARLGGRNLRTQLLPIGQEGAFAGPLAERYPTAGAVVAAVREAIAEHLNAAAAHQPLAPGSPFAAARGLTVPVAQGPMTRVSDRAAFALAVAEAGGLPFLALALMGGDEVRALLEETSARLRGRPWGVGILGFVPAELRETQLAVVHDVRPPCALIAGGRPSQAAPLEAAGIDTFLHVPSPGLLDRFLLDGARKFVFEGRECGGHVGPRSSFALWESQIERLLAFGHLDEVHVLFAGGIHDERSAAMVAALAAPLAAGGAKVGVLMGTAYLFTEEAVASGAIVAGFQSAALTCDSTVLLETSPGHATRCVDTDYVRSFRETKERLRGDGASQQEMWARAGAAQPGPAAPGQQGRPTPGGDAGGGRRRRAAPPGDGHDRRGGHPAVGHDHHLAAARSGEQWRLRTSWMPGRPSWRTTRARPWPTEGTHWRSPSWGWRVCSRRRATPTSTGPTWWPAWTP